MFIELAKALAALVEAVDAGDNSRIPALARQYVRWYRKCYSPGR